MKRRIRPISLKRLKRLGRVPRSTVEAKPRRSRFPHRRSPEYRKFVVTLGCVAEGRTWKGELPTGQRVRFVHHCAGPIDPAHVKSQGAGADDWGEILPACRRAHDWQETCGGIKAWAEGFGWTLGEVRRMASEIAVRYEQHLGIRL